MDKEHQAIERLQAASAMSLKVYGLPLVVTTSGGKDSSICLHLAQASRIPFEVLHSHTTADAPETVYFVRGDLHRLEDKGIKCDTQKPVYKGEAVSMWSLIPQKSMPPTRLVRYCCDVLKETGGRNRFISTGVRWAESTNRQGRGIYETPQKDRKKSVILNNDNDDRRRLFETCALKAKRVVNPIIDWTDHDVWDYIKSEHIRVNPLYAEGFCRVGCVGCPMAGKNRHREFARWPKYKAMYISAFDRMIAERNRRGLPTEWKNGQECFAWWMEDKNLPGQINLEDYEEEEI